MINVAVAGSKLRRSGMDNRGEIVLSESISEDRLVDIGASAGGIAVVGREVNVLIYDMDKDNHPQTAGLWILPAGSDDLLISLRLGFGSAPPGGRHRDKMLGKSSQSLIARPAGLRGEGIPEDSGCFLAWVELVSSFTQGLKPSDHLESWHMVGYTETGSKLSCPSRLAQENG